jgi:hypothetical protein
VRLAGIRAGDVVRVRTRRGDDFYALVADDRARRAGEESRPRRLALEPIGPGRVRAGAGARDVVGHWRRAARS